MHQVSRCNHLTDVKFYTLGRIGQRVHLEVDVALEGHEGVGDTPYSLLEAWINWSKSVPVKTGQIRGLTLWSPEQQRHFSHLSSCHIPNLRFQTTEGDQRNNVKGCCNQIRLLDGGGVGRQIYLQQSDNIASSPPHEGKQTSLWSSHPYLNQRV